MQRIGAIALVAALVIIAISTANDAGAQTYRWCAIYGQSGGAQNCGFNSREQCQSAISGAGGTCHENPMYSGSDSAERPARKKRSGN